MSDETLNDLKQFITATVSRQNAELRLELRDELRNEFKNELHNELGGVRLELSGLRTDITRVEHKLDGFIEFVTEALDTQSDMVDEQFKNHEARILKLEQATRA